MSINSLNHNFPTTPIDAKSSHTSNPTSLQKNSDKTPRTSNEPASCHRPTPSGNYNQQKLMDQLKQGANKVEGIATAAAPLVAMLPERSTQDSNKTDASDHHTKQIMHKAKETMHIIKETVHKVAEGVGKAGDVAAAAMPVVAIATAAAPPADAALMTGLVTAAAIGQAAKAVAAATA